MKNSILAALLAAISLSTVALADPVGEKAQAVAASEAVADRTTSIDARSVASDAEVGVARRAYRAACSRYQNAGYCDCVTAGVAQALSPADVRLAARTIRQRINTAPVAGGASDADAANTDAMSRIAAVEGHNAATCAEFRS